LRSTLFVIALCGVANAQPAELPPASDAPPVERAPVIEDKAPAVRAFEDGRALLDESKFSEACAKFEESIRLEPDAPGTLLNLGLCNERLGKTATALMWFRKAQFKSSETPGMGDYEDAAKSKTKALVASVPAISIQLAHPAPANATFLLDGTTIQEVDFGHLEVDPSHHTLEMQAAGKTPVRVEFTIAASEQKTIVVPVEAPVKNLVLVDRGATRRLVAYGLGAVSVGLFTGSAIVSLSAKHDFDAVEHPEDRQHYTNVARFGGTSLFIGGAAALVGATYLYLHAPSAEWVPVVGEHSLGVTRAF
jgi:hypothetical protein